MLQAGFARVDVTPPLGTPLAGYFEVRLAGGVMDPIELNALAFGNETDTALLIAADFTGMTMARINPLRERLAALTGVPADRIMITSLHQHTSIYVGDACGDAEDYALITDKDYLELLDRKFCEVARLALADKSEARLFSAEQQAEPALAFTRRYVMADGTLRTNPNTQVYGAPVRRCEQPDNTVRLLRFVREGKREIDVVNFSTHPDVVGANAFSADWPGQVRALVEKECADVCCMCTVGCQGDSNHVDFFKPASARIVGGGGSTHAAYMGETIARAVKRMRQGVCTAHTGECVFGGVQLIHNKLNTSGAEFYDEAVAFIENYDRGEEQCTPHINDIALAMRTVRLRTEGATRAVPVTLLSLGDVCFVGFGGEPFTSYGTAVRELAPDQTVLCCCCANGYEGYLPTAKAFAEGGYEINTSLFTPTPQQECMGAVSRLLQKR